MRLEGHIRARAVSFAGALAIGLLTFATSSHALDAIVLDDDRAVVDLTPFAETYHEREGQQLSISAPDSSATFGDTAPDSPDSDVPDEASQPDTSAAAENGAESGAITLSDGASEANGVWLAIALRNRSQQPVTRYLVVTNA